MQATIPAAPSLVSYCVWYIRTLASEVRSLPHRIQMLSRRTNRQNFPVDLGPLFEKSPTGEIVPCKATIARTQYVEFLLARFPWASGGDVLLALDGWEKGTELVRRTADTSNMDAEESRRNQYPLALVEQ
jgi:hypothetical protein